MIHLLTISVSIVVSIEATKRDKGKVETLYCYVFNTYNKLLNCLSSKLTKYQRYKPSYVCIQEHV